jgi:two-component system sensor histidine kinase/response regulator
MAVIYVVDDEATNRELIAAFLAGSGHTLVQFARGDDALAHCDAQPPDLVLLDVLMPGLDGFTTVELIKRRAGIYLPVIMVTALSDIQSRRQALLAGADDFLTKPLDPEELALRVRNQLALRQSATAQLERNVELVELQRFRTDMSQTIVHDLKNPACAVLSTIEYALEESSKLPEEVVEALRDAHKASRRLSELLVNLLDMTRIETARFKLVREPVAAEELLREVATPRQLDARRRKIDITYNIAGDVTHVDVDRSLFVRIIENLLDNAMRYTPPKGRIVLSIRRSASGTCLEVGNSGAPVPEQARSVVFEKFGQARSDSGRMNLGLGLYFCRLAVEAHGGRIWIEERPELPTVFCIELPEGVHD